MRQLPNLSIRLGCSHHTRPVRVYNRLSILVQPLLTSRPRTLAFPSGLGLRHSLTLPRGPVRAGCYADGMFYSRLEQFSHTAQMPAASIAFSVYHIARARILGIGPAAFPMRLQRACLRSRNRRLSLLFLCCTFTCEQAHSEVCTQKNREIFISRFLGLAEREGFEPPNPFRSTVFKTAAFDHSAISPIPFWDCKSRNKSLFCKKIFYYFSEKNL